MNEVIDDIPQKVDNGNKFAKRALFCSAGILLIYSYYMYRLFGDLKVNSLEPPPLIFGILMRVFLFLNFTFVLISIYKKETPSWVKWLATVLFLLIITITVAPIIFFQVSGW